MEQTPKSQWPGKGAKDPLYSASVRKAKGRSGETGTGSKDLAATGRGGTKVSPPPPEVHWETIERAFDAAMDSIFVSDGERTIIRANKAFARAFGYEPAALVGRKCYEIVHGTEVPPPDCPHSVAVETGVGYASEYFDWRRGIRTLVSVSPIFSDAHEVLGYLHIAKDKVEELPAGTDGSGKQGMRDDGQGEYKLTPRQRQILELLCQGMLVKQIAFRLRISSRTVEFHKRRMMEGLRIRTVAELIGYAVKQSIAK